MMYFLAFLQASRAALARLYPCKVAKTIEVGKDSLKELVSHVRRSIRHPWILVGFQTLLFWKPKMTCGCSRSPRRSLVVAGTGVSLGIVFLFPFLKVGLFKRFPNRDPEGLPATYPFGHRHDTRQGSRNVIHKKTRSKGKTTRKVSHACTSCR